MKLSVGQLSIEPKRIDYPAPRFRRIFYLRYGLFMLVSNLLWESVHLPLYTLWAESDSAELVFTVLHCTVGDLMIAMISLVIAQLLTSNFSLSQRLAAPAIALTIALGLTYTIFSEWLNISIRESWAYSELMPVIPIIDAGLSPVAQWLVLPLLGLIWAAKSTR